MAKVTNSTSTFTFPTGKNSTYRDIGITPSSADETTFTAEYFDQAYSNTSSLSGLNNVSTVEYFTLDRSGDANASVILHWGSNSGVSNLSDLRVARWDGSQWTDAGNSATTGDVSAGTITSNLVTSYSPFTFGSSSGDNSLPVEVTSFTARQEKSQVILEWITESEIENLGFILERRNLKFETGNWEEIASYKTHAELRGQGSTTSQTEYQFTDATVQPGLTYEYRPTDVDYSGNTKYHYTRSVTIKSTDQLLIPETFALKPAYPNPFNPYTVISFTLPEEAEVSIRIIDVRGKTVRLLVHNQGYLAGEFSIFWNGKSNTGIPLSSGVYFLQLITGENIRSQKIVLLR